jgi:hypothetical protein
MHRNFQVRLLAAIGLTLIERELATVDVLRAEPNNIAAAQPGVREAVRTQPACGAKVPSRIKNQTARAMIVIPMTIRSPVIRLGAGA